MYRMPEKQTGCGMVSKCGRSCFLSVCKSPILSLTFHQTEMTFLPLFDLFLFILYYFCASWILLHAMVIHIYFCFTYTYANYPSSGGFHWRAKCRLRFLRCLPLWTPFLFWLSRFYKLSFRLFISTFYNAEKLWEML